MSHSQERPPEEVASFSDDEPSSPEASPPATSEPAAKWRKPAAIRKARPAHKPTARKISAKSALKSSKSAITVRDAPAKVRKALGKARKAVAKAIKALGKAEKALNKAHRALERSNPAPAKPLLARSTQGVKVLPRKEEDDD